MDIWRTEVAYVHSPTESLRQGSIIGSLGRGH
jgi:hypothetical protein